jgi:hypothetical protein
MTSVLLRNEGKTDVKIELFFAESWPQAAGAGPGLYRLRIDGQWFIQGGEKYTFLAQDGVARLLASELFAGADPQCLVEGVADLPAGTPVRVPTGEHLQGSPLYNLSRTATPTIQGIDGRWYVGVILVGKGTVMVAVDALRIG